MNARWLFPLLLWLPVPAPGFPAPLPSHMEFSSFEIGTNPDNHHPYCLLFLNGTYRENISIVQDAGHKDTPSGFSVTDSTGKTYRPEAMAVYPGEAPLQRGGKNFSIQISLPQWPSVQAKWLHLRGAVSVTCTHPLSLYPAEMELSPGKSIQIPLLGDDMPRQEDIADPSRLEHLSLSMRKQKEENKNAYTWQFSIAYSDDFLFYGLEFEDMQGRPIPILKYSPGILCSGGGGTVVSESYTLPRSCKNLQVRVLYLDPRHFETRLLHVDMKIGMGGILPPDHVAKKQHPVPTVSP